jgi:carbamoyltransferase
LEIIISKIINTFIHSTNVRDIVVSGGVALNSKAIFEVSKIKEINSITVPQNPGDSGSSIGAAIFGQMLNNFPLPKMNLFPGKNYNSHIKSDIFESLFKKISNKVSRISDISHLIVNGEIICIFLNNREIGPRALGSRSIICSGKNKSSITKLNINYKNREEFRPLAPVLREAVSSKYFYIPKKLKHNLYWMGALVTAKQKTITEYPECIHIDNTSRVQIIKDKSNFLYKLLEKLEKHNLDIIINTSFNIAGDPIVFDYIDCYTNMKRMNLKYLVTDNGLFERL